MAVIIDAEVAFERILMRPVAKQYTHYGIVKYILYVTMYPTCPAKKVGKTAEASRFAEVNFPSKILIMELTSIAFIGLLK